MGEQAKHTPLPWRFEKHQDFSQYFGNIVGSYGKDELGLESIRTITIQLKYGAVEEQQANAEFITRACNAHDDLVATLQLLQGFDFRLDDSPHGKEIRRRALAALAKAESRP